MIFNSIDLTVIFLSYLHHVASLKVLDWDGLFGYELPAIFL